MFQRSYLKQRERWRLRLSGQSGQSLFEYGAILMFVAIVVLVTVKVIGHQTNQYYSNVSNGFRN